MEAAARPLGSEGDAWENVRPTRMTRVSRGVARRSPRRLTTTARCFGRVWQVSWLADCHLAEPSRPCRPVACLGDRFRSQLRGQPRHCRFPAAHRVPFSPIRTNRTRTTMARYHERRLVSTKSSCLRLQRRTFRAAHALERDQATHQQRCRTPEQQSTRSWGLGAELRPPFYTEPLP